MPAQFPEGRTLSSHRRSPYEEGHVRSKRLLGGDEWLVMRLYIFTKPRIICAKVPEMTFEVAARIRTSTVILILDIHYDLCTRINRSAIMSVSVRYDDIRALSVDTSDIARGFLESVKIGS